MWWFMDFFLILVGLGVLAWGVYRQAIGMLLTWAAFWLAVVLAGGVLVTFGGAYGLGMTIQRALWGSAPSTQLVQVILFSLIWGGVFLGLHLLTHLVFPNTGIPKLGIVDNILGGILGVLLGLAVLALLSNLWRLAVEVPWRPVTTWRAMQEAYRFSFLAPALRPALVVLNKIFFPFLLTGYPTVLVP